MRQTNNIDTLFLVLVCLAVLVLLVGPVFPRIAVVTAAGARDIVPRRPPLALAVPAPRIRIAVSFTATVGALALAPAM